VLPLWNTLITLGWPALYLYPPFRGTIGRRLGRFELGRYDPRAAGPRVLINAVSAGEVVAITPFVTELLRQRPDAQIALLTTTESGQTMAREKLGDQLALLAYFPLIDLPFIVRRYLDRLKPDLYVTTEAELWPNIMTGCRQRKIPVALVNARIYLHNKHGWRAALHQRLYELVDLVVCQSEQQRVNFLKFGLRPDKLTVSGNTKFDFELKDWDGELLGAARVHFGLGDERVIVAGSTHPGEEELLLRTLGGAPASLAGGRLRLIVAPRHVERAAEVAKLAAQQGLGAVLLKDLPAAEPWDVLVVDRYGVLTDTYRLADVVVMGGTFSRQVGGHNILEATVLGKPVLVGPHTFSITAQLELLRQVGGIVEVRDSEALAAELTRLLGQPAAAARIGAAAREATLANRGAAQRAVEAVLGLLAPTPGS